MSSQWVHLYGNGDLRRHLRWKKPEENESFSIFEISLLCFFSRMSMRKLFLSSYPFHLIGGKVWTYIGRTPCARCPKSDGSVWRTRSWSLENFKTNFVLVYDDGTHISKVLLGNDHIEGFSSVSHRTGKNCGHSKAAGGVVCKRSVDCIAATSEDRIFSLEKFAPGKVSDARCCCSCSRG